MIRAPAAPVYAMSPSSDLHFFGVAWTQESIRAIGDVYGCGKADMSHGPAKQDVTIMYVRRTMHRPREGIQRVREEESVY
jgi:hypothetical protein